MAYDFDPDRVAQLEASGWRAYYDRRWPKLLQLVVALGQEQFRIPFPASLLSAYYVTRAAAAWAPVDHDVDKVQSFYERFYRIAARCSGLDFDPVRVAELETRYNDVHRRLAGKLDKSEFVETMVALHGAIFGLSPDQVRESAEWRVKANNTVDLITSGASADVDADWVRLEEYLRRCYGSIRRALHPAEGQALAAAASNHYQFVTNWRVEGTVEEVSTILGDAVSLSRWWPSVYLDVRSLDLGDGGESDRVVSLHTKGWLPYTLNWRFRVVESRHPHGFTIDAWGDFVGTGVWQFEQDGPFVNVTYDWKIRADKPLLRYLSFALKPIFAANHHWAMAQGEKSLKLQLARQRAATPGDLLQVPEPPGPTSTVAQVSAVAALVGLGGLALLLRGRLPARRVPRMKLGKSGVAFASRFASLTRSRALRYLGT